MKQVLFAFLITAILFSCSDDDEDPVIEVNSQLVIEGETYTFSNGLIEDYGTIGTSTQDTHYNYDFYIADAEIDFSSSSTQIQILFYAELFSASTDNFQAGTFDFIQLDENTEISEIQGRNFFALSDIFLVGNDDIFYEATGGSIVVIENGNLNYTVQVNLMMQKFEETDTDAVAVGSPINVSFSYSGEFDYVDER
ncbi:MAG: hypothetical protein AAF789_04175 [Bacteroidota bacterium]